MKTLLPIFCLLLLIAPALPAQIVDRSLSFGFVAAPLVVEPMGTDKWLVVGKGMPYRGSVDRYFVQVFDQEGAVFSSVLLPPQGGEISNVFDAWPLADGAFLIFIGSRPCDSGYDYTSLQKYTPDGQLIWTLYGSLYNNTQLPYYWKIAPDGHLLGLYQDEMWKVDINNGSVLWKANLLGLNTNPLPFYFDLLPGSEDFLGLGTHDFQIWKKYESPNGPFYSLSNSLVTDNYYGFGFAPNGWYYAWNFLNSHLERVNADLQFEMLNAFIDVTSLPQMAAVEDGLYFLGRKNDQNWLRKTDFLGENPVSLPMPDRWLTGRSIAARGDSVVVVGTDGSGPKSAATYDYFYPENFQSLQLWLRTFTGPSPALSADTTNASVTGLQQLSGVDTLSQPETWHHYFSLQGGDFQVQITNRGNTILEQVFVNFSYEADNYSFCPSTPAEQRLFTNLQLAPGDSTWIDFGDLAFPYLASLSSEFCFWTSAPNGRPDAIHEDDHYCAPATYTVPTHTPADQTVKVVPNPARDYFQVVAAAGLEEFTWHLHDATGRLVQSGIYPAGQSELTVSTQSLPDGFYFFRLHNYSGKLMVKH